MRNHERLARAAEALVFVALGALYARTAARHVLGGDNGEFVAVAASGGVAHPPGYPLYTLFLQLGALIPGASPAHRASLVTVVISVLSVAALAHAARAWGASRLGSVLCAALYAVSPLAWTLGTHAEVFTLNVLLAMLLVAASSPHVKPRPFVLGLLAGLGLANHHTIVLLAPASLLAFARALRNGKLRALVAGLAGLAVGLLPYAYVVVRANALGVGEGCIWGAPRDLAGLLRHFLRRDYGTFQLSISDARPAPLAHALAMGESLVVGSSFTMLLLPVALVAWLASSRSGPSGPSGRRLDRAAVAALVGSLVLAGPAFASRFNLATEGLAARVTERFQLLPLALTMVLVALAIDVCVRAAGRSSRLPVIVVGLLGTGAFVVRAGMSLPEVAEHHRPTLELYVENVLRSAPPHAIILHSGDDRTGAFMYARCALGLRPDVEAVAPELLLTDWYPPQVSARLGIDIVRGRRVGATQVPTLSARELIEQLLETGRPLFVTDWFVKGMDRTTPSYPLGPMIRLVADPAEIPPPEALLARNEQLFATFTLEPTLPRRATWAGARIRDYARPWLVLAQAFEAQGDAARADTCRARARSFTPP